MYRSDWFGGGKGWEGRGEDDLFSIRCRQRPGALQLDLVRKQDTAS